MVKNGIGIGTHPIILDKRGENDIHGICEGQTFIVQ